MKISSDAIRKYKKLYRKRFGENLSDKEASRQATKLLNLVELTYRPITRVDYEKYSKKNEIDG